MEYLALGIFLVAINELREWRTAQKQKALVEMYGILTAKFDDHQKKLVHIMDVLSDVLDHMNDNSSEMIKLHKELTVLKETQEASNQFIAQAKTDLETIVKEYKINGIPMGMQRRTNAELYDMVEGL